jgi:hypothetical protein
MELYKKRLQLLLSVLLERYTDRYLYNPSKKRDFHPDNVKKEEECLLPAEQEIEVSDNRHWFWRHGPQNSLFVDSTFPP